MYNWITLVNLPREETLSVSDPTERSYKVQYTPLSIAQNVCTQLAVVEVLSPELQACKGPSGSWPVLGLRRLLRWPGAASWQRPAAHTSRLATVNCRCPPYSLCLASQCLRPTSLQTNCTVLCASVVVTWYYAFDCVGRRRACVRHHTNATTMEMEAML